MSFPKKMTGLVLTVILSFATYSQAADWSKPIAETHAGRGLSCEQCHGEAKPTAPPLGQKCTQCHSNHEKLVSATANRFIVNPHSPPHNAPGDPVYCEECHVAHAPPKVSCVECHKGFESAFK